MGHTASGVSNLQPEESLATGAPFRLFRHVGVGFLVVCESYVLPALWWACPGSTDANADFFPRAVFSELDGIGTGIVSMAYSIKEGGPTAGL
jgi:hypothetical protein